MDIIINLADFPTAELDIPDNIDWAMLDFSLETPLERFSREYPGFPDELYVFLEEQAVLDERKQLYKFVKKNGIWIRHGSFLISFS